MTVNPIYQAGAQLREFFNEGDHVYALQRITPHFDKQFNDTTFELISAGRAIRQLYLTGEEIGDTENEGKHRYYLLIS